MRQGYYSFGPGYGLTPAIKWLMIANGIVFALQLVSGYTMVMYFGLVPQLVIHKGFLWQFVTYMFLHGGIFHILFNMFALWMFGTEIERYWGTREFTKYYFICGIGAGILTFLTSLSSVIPTIGASGAIYGILVAFAMMFPDRYIYVYFFFPVKAKYLVVFFAAVEFFASWNPQQSGVAHLAHLGGMLIGYLYLKLDWRIEGFFRKFQQMSSERRERVKHRKEEQRRRLMEEVDRILDKINKQGMESLTKEEKKKLDQASHLLSEKKSPNLK
jgi:membrane associated rhomboid family serine protease